MDKSKLIIIDGMSLIYRAYYGWPINPDANIPNNAVQGFFTWFSKLIEDYNPTHLFVAFDAYGPSFRKEALPTYKDGRQKTPDDLISQVPIIKRGLDKLGIKHLEVKGFEADDIAASLATMSDAAGFQVLVCSADKDLIQLVNTNISLIVPIRGLKEVDIITPERALAKYDIPANRYRELAALVGEKADNLPGIAGVGPKTAANLINNSDDLESLLEGSADKPNKVSKAIHEGADTVRLNYKLNKLVTDMEIVANIELGQLDLKRISNTAAFNGFCRDMNVERVGHRLVNTLENLLNPSQGTQGMFLFGTPSEMYGSYVEGEEIPLPEEEPPPF